MDTLVRDPFRDVMPSFFGMTLTEMMQLKHPNAWGRFERGELAEEEFLSSFFADGRTFDEAGFKRAIRESYVWLPGMEQLLGRVASRGHAMHVLSNYPPWYQWIEARLGLARYVSWSFVSCHIGLRKPDPAIYRYAVSKLGVDAGDCVFIDDRAANCEGARLTGMHALHFRGDAAALESELSTLLLTQQSLG